MLKYGYPDCQIDSQTNIIHVHTCIGRFIKSHCIQSQYSPFQNIYNIVCQRTPSAVPLVPHRQLQVQALGLTLLLRLEHTLPGGAEICHLHAHTTLTQCHHTRLGADGLDVGTGQVVLL